MSDVPALQAEGISLEELKTVVTALETKARRARIDLSAEVAQLKAFLDKLATSIAKAENPPPPPPPFSEPFRPGVPGAGTPPRSY